MDALAKFFSKLKQEDQLSLLELYRELKDPASRKTLDIKKLSGGDFFRVRKGRLRVIFHFEEGEIVIDATRFRDEKTYRGV